MQQDVSIFIACVEMFQRMINSADHLLVRLVDRNKMLDCGNTSLMRFSVDHETSRRFRKVKFERNDKTRFVHIKIERDYA